MNEIQICTKIFFMFLAALRLLKAKFHSNTHVKDRNIVSQNIYSEFCYFFPYLVEKIINNICCI